MDARQEQFRNKCSVLGTPSLRQALARWTHHIHAMALDGMRCGFLTLHLAWWREKGCHGTCKHASNRHRCGSSTWHRMNTNFTLERITLHNASAFDSILGRRRRSHGLLSFQLLSLHLLSGDDFSRCERPAMSGGALSGLKGA